MGWFGLGRPRTRFGKWMEEQGVTQEELSQKSGVSRGTISRLASKDDARPGWRNRKKLREALRAYDEEYADDFWDD
ncbi:helix-turn-helix transcriptional regulator [Alicyclobacillus cycloheptanicus]|uniref:Transcriptional regulator with XRE-family HTH domain n=1 Tax=Alicyclobacillus cycloheptanicus TaxID=1457 RepID=A0ABT9XEK8_9BACL|nr:helix-turn-helix transcriptional regulator [Alicyclobacillus cycloheptanicus]MDQ0188253.1 transcriptional regulator with XRE-family HTH domain [Alicyclobacillus cycloheptanicus]WDM00976.1 helix-turn-helix transcriptional regulator [Alicyclobacillus cycloheptanicus]